MDIDGAISNTTVRIRQSVPEITESEYSHTQADLQTQSFLVQKVNRDLVARCMPIVAEGACPSGPVWMEEERSRVPHRLKLVDLVHLHLAHVPVSTPTWDKPDAIDGSARARRRMSAPTYKHP